MNEEARKRNGSLPGMGGVYNIVNLHLYHYAANNPVKYIDPDGRIDIEDSEKVKMEALYNIANDINKVVDAYLGIIIDTFNNGNNEQKFELVESLAETYVNYRKEFFQMERDSEDVSTSPDFSMYRNSLYAMFDKATTLYNKMGKESALGSIKGDVVNRLINPTAMDKYSIDQKNIVILQKMVNENFFGEKKMKSLLIFIILFFPIKNTMSSEETKYDFDHKFETDLDWSSIGDIYFKPENNRNIEIVDINKVENLDSIQELFFSNSILINFENIKMAGNLELLYIHNCIIDSLNGFNYLTSLRTLTIRFSGLKNINFLNSLTFLTELDLSYNYINDLTPISNLTNLKELTLSYNEIIDIYPVKYLSNLLLLDISNNRVIDYTELQYLKKLTNAIISPQKTWLE